MIPPRRKKRTDPATSLTSKLLTLKPGETLYLDDPRDVRKNTLLDGAVQSAVFKSDALKGQKFSTERCIAVRTSPVTATPILAIRRQDLPPTE